MFFPYRITKFVNDLRKVLLWRLSTNVQKIFSKIYSKLSGDFRCKTFFFSEVNHLFNEKELVNTYTMSGRLLWSEQPSVKKKWRNFERKTELKSQIGNIWTNSVLNASWLHEINFYKHSWVSVEISLALRS